MKCVKVSLRDAQKVKRELIANDLIDLKYRAHKDSSFIYFPVKKKVKGFDCVDMDLKEREVRKDLKGSISLMLSKDELKELRSSVDQIGTIAIIEIPEELDSKDKVIAEHVLGKSIKTVLRKGKHEGEYRTQKLKFLAGNDTRETIHKENGVSIMLDVEKVYFSPRLSNERKRIMLQVDKAEDILVIGSGCGPYTCVLAKNTGARGVDGVEVNPVGHEYALKNIALNKLKNARAILGDAAIVVPGLGKSYGRIVMPMPKTADDFLEVAISVAKPGAIIHFYDFQKEGEEQRSVDKLKKAAIGEVLGIYKCGQDKPRSYRICVDYKLE